MVSSNARTPDEYIASLPEDRRAAVSAVRDVIRANLPAGYEEGMQYGMIGWYVPLERFPDTYNGQPLGLAALASQKHHLSLYLNSVTTKRRAARHAGRAQPAARHPEAPIRTRLRSFTDDRSGAGC